MAATVYLLHLTPHCRNARHWLGGVTEFAISEQRRCRLWRRVRGTGCGDRTLARVPICRRSMLRATWIRRMGPGAAGGLRDRRAFEPSSPVYRGMSRLAVRSWLAAYRKVVRAWPS